MHRWHTALVLLLSQQLVYCSMPSIIGDYSDVLNLQQLPTSFGAARVFSDLGAWHGFGLIPANETAHAGTFTGPLIHSGWAIDDLGYVGVSMSQVLLATSTGKPLTVKSTESHFLPGQLTHTVLYGEGVQLSLALVFSSNRTSLTRIRIINLGDAPLELAPLAFAGDVSSMAAIATGGVSFPPDGWGSDVRLVREAKALDVRALVRYSPNLRPVAGALSNDGVHFNVSSGAGEQHLGVSTLLESFLTHTVCFNASECAFHEGVALELLASPARCASIFADSEARWTQRLATTFALTGANAQARWVAVKSLVTLYTSWRSANGALRSDGIYPSISSYQGFWSWDSWKHAAALATIDPWLAVSSLQSLFDFQGDASFLGGLADGMVTDVVFAWYNVSAGSGGPPTAVWSNTKPPLASWAAAAIAANLPPASAAAFLCETYPKLRRMHDWWYARRDADGDGLCEFGANRAGKDQARGESGMDNAVRFDNQTLVGPPDGARSLDHAAVDLNAHLYADKLRLAAIADAVAPGDAPALRTAAAALLVQLRDGFFGAPDGWPRDRALANGSHALLNVSPGCEGFAALWAGVPTAEQAVRMAALLQSPAHFGTPVPFASFSASDPLFAADGYWRGPVWLDQAWFALQGLRRYDALVPLADALQARLFAAIPGLSLGNTEPLCEYYNPLTAACDGASGFGWSAAHALLMVTGGR